jgi:hypothetical protein
MPRSSDGMEIKGDPFLGSVEAEPGYREMLRLLKLPE